MSTNHLGGSSLSKSKEVWLSTIAMKTKDASPALPLQMRIATVIGGGGGVYSHFNQTWHWFWDALKILTIGRQRSNM